MSINRQNVYLVSMVYNFFIFSKGEIYERKN